MQRIVVLTGAGISAESGIKTFRDSNGLWEEYKIEDVATFDAWQRNPKLVMQFYNERRKQLIDAKPNAAHLALAQLEKNFQVDIITQNVDDLHEKAGSTNILHLHGELRKSRSTVDENLIYNVDGWELKMGDLCEKKSQLRPHIVWFGEDVPNIQIAAQMAAKANVFIIVGTSMNVYPAAGLIHSVPEKTPKFLIDPNEINVKFYRNLTFIKAKAGEGLPNLVQKLITNT